MSQETKKLQERIAELEALLENKTTELNQRVNELKAVLHVSTLSDISNLTLEDFYAYVLKVIVSGLRYPDIACAELQLGEKHYTTDKFRKSPWKIGRALAVQNKMFGYLTVYYLEELPKADNGPFTKEEKDLIVVMTRYLSQITRWKQFEEESRMFNTVIAQSSPAVIITDQKAHESLIDIMHQIDSLSNINASLEDFLQMVFHYLKRIAWIDVGGVYLFDDDRKHLRLVYAEGLSDDYVNKVAVFLTEDPPAQSILKRKPKYRRANDFLETLKGHIIKEGLTFTASIPLIYQEEVIGSLNLASRRVTDIDPVRRQAVESIASRLATLVALVKTREQLKRANEELSLTIQKMSENQQLLIQKSKLESLGELSAGLAHEINQPLSVISLVTENMEMQVRKDTVSKDYMQKKISSINENIHKIRELIDHVRIFSRDQGSILYEQVDVNKAILSAFSLVSAQLSHHNIKVIKELGDNLGYTLGNPSRLEQVIFNLISNARDALDEKEKLIVFDMPEKEIIVSTTHVNNNIIIRIRDNGTGIPPEKLSQVLNPFFTTKDEGKGTGLGLSIVYGIVQEMKGDIKIKSELNQFTEVTVSLPRYSGVKKK